MMIASLDSRVNPIARDGGDPIRTLNEYEKLRFDNEEEIHMSSPNHEDSDDGLDLDLLTL